MEALSFKRSRWKKAAIWVMVLCFSLGMFSFPAQSQAAGYKLKYVTFEGGPHSTTDSTPIKISAHYFLPSGAVPEGGFPVVVFIHSWCMNQNEYDYNMAQFASKGYITICYNCRGWWGADGNDQVCGPMEMADLNKVLDWTIANLPVNPDKIGATGISYGGGHSMLALKFAPRIKAIVSMSGWADLVESLYPNYTFKTSWGGFLAGSGFVLANPDDSIMNMINKCLAYENLYQTVEASDRSVLYHIDEINARDDLPPVFMIQGINEDLFTTRQMVRFYDQYAGQKKITLANGVHATAEIPGTLGIPNSIWKDAMRWFDYHLKGQNTGIMSEKPISIYQQWNTSKGTYNTWPANSSITFYPSFSDTGMLIASNEATGSVTIKNNPYSFTTTSGLFMISPALKSYANMYIAGVDPDKLGVGAKAFDSDILTENTTVMGVPSFSFKVKPDIGIFQLNCLIYDVDENGNSRLIDNVPYTEPHAIAGQVNSVNFEMNSYMAYQFAAGHKIRLVVSTNNTAHFMPISKAFSADLLCGSGTKMVLPIMN